MFVIFLLLYNIFLALILPFATIYYILRIVKKKDTIYSFLQKFGIYFLATPLKKYDIWFHASSVGEVKSLEFITQRYSAKKILITTTTLKSKEVVNKYNNPNITHYFLPLDFVPLYMLFFLKNRCKTVIIAESEVWPNFYAFLRILNKKVIMFNARASQKTQQRWQKFSKILFHTLKVCSVIIAQSKNSYEFFQKFHRNVKYFGNLKLLNLYGVKQSDIKIDNFCKQHSNILCVASTHEGEDVSIIEAVSQHKNFGIIYIPRHPHRVGEITKILQKYNITHNLYSRFKSNAVQCLVVDDIGLMINCLEHAKIAIFGGSFLPHLKGHNIMEAAQFGCTIITGLFVETFEEIVEEMRYKNAIIQCDIKRISHAITLDKNSNAGINAKKYIAENKPDITKILTYFA